MIRKLMIAVCLFCATHAVAQANKNTEKQPVETDYKQPGDPMPSLLLVRLHDSNARKRAVDKLAKENNQGTKKKKKREESLPLNLDQQFITNKDLDNGANLFVMMFNPTCPHCETVTEMFVENITLFEKTKIVLVAKRMMEEYLPNFIKSYHTNDHAQIYVGTDSSAFIDKVFLYGALPQINVYDKKRQLLKIFNGDVAIDSLKKYIE